jgi:hypothetical protein
MTDDLYVRAAIAILVGGALVIVPGFVILGLGRDAARKRRLIPWFAGAYALLVGGFTYAAARAGDAPAVPLAAFAAAVAFYLIWTLAVCARCAAVTPRLRPLVPPPRCRSCGSPLG